MRTLPIKQRADRRRIFITLAVNAAVLLLCALFGAPRIINNDDIILHYLTAGAYGAGSPVLPHTNILLGWALVLLQNACSAVNWFVVLELVLLYISFSGVGGALWLKNPGKPGFALMLSVAAGLAPFFYTQLHNTKCAPLIAAAGLLMVLQGIERRRLSAVFAGAFAALAASMIRFDAFLIGCAFVFGAVLVHLCTFRQAGSFRAWFKQHTRCFAVYAAVFAVIFGIHLMGGTIAARDPAVAYYNEYNYYRGIISDYSVPVYDDAEARYAELGLSRNDLFLLQNWSMADTEVFDIETLRAVSELKPAATQPPGARLAVAFADELLPNPWFWLAVLAALLSLILNGARGRGLSAWCFAAMLLCFFVLTSDGRTTRWITAGICGAMTVTLLWAFDARQVSARFFKMRGGGLALLLAACVTLSAVAVVPQAGLYTRVFSKERYTDTVYGELMRHPENLYLLDISSAPGPETVIPTFSAVPRNLLSNVWLTGGWDSGSPAKETVLARYGVTGSPFAALVERTDVYLLDTNNYESKITYVREHFYPDASAALYATFSGQYVFSFSDDLPDCPVREDFTIAGCALSVSEISPSFLFIALQTTRALEEGEAVYVRVTTPRGDAHTYRTQPYGGSAVTVTVPFLDFTGLDFEISLIVTRGGEWVATPPVAASLA